MGAHPIALERDNAGATAVPRITDLALKNLPLPERGHVTYWDRPLWVRVSSTGVKTFIVILQSGRRHKIGRYGDITLAQAREAASKLKAEKTLGRLLPVPIRFDVAREEYLNALDVRPNTRLYYERTLKRLAAGKVAEITLRDIQHAVADLGLASRNQALASFRAFFKMVRPDPPQRALDRFLLWEGLQIVPSKKRKRFSQTQSCGDSGVAAADRAGDIRMAPLCSSYDRAPEQRRTAERSQVSTARGSICASKPSRFPIGLPKITESTPSPTAIWSLTFSKVCRARTEPNCSFHVASPTSGHCLAGANSKRSLRTASRAGRSTICVERSEPIKPRSERLHISESG